MKRRDSDVRFRSLADILFSQSRCPVYTSKSTYSGHNLLRGYTFLEAIVLQSAHSLLLDCCVFSFAVLRPSESEAVGVLGAQQYVECLC